MKRLLAPLLALTLPFAILADAIAEPLQIEAKPITRFLPSSGETKFGKLEFLGGLELTADHEEFGGFSGARFRDDGTLVLLTDKARVVTTSILREGEKPVGLTDAQITRIKASNGRTITGAEDKDAEALEIAGNAYFVGYERNDRLMRFSIKNRTLVANADYIVDFNPEDFPNNKGLEAIALNPLSGKLHVFAEHALDKNGNHRGFIVSNGKIETRYAIRLRNSFSLTDAAFLPNGDLLLLERYFNPIFGVYLRMRRVASHTLGGDKPIDGEILIDVDGNHEIDNMEGLAISAMEDGSTRLTIVSDDNFSGRQRTLLLEFRLLN